VYVGLQMIRKQSIIANICLVATTLPRTSAEA
jgi:hypothetical protein